MSRHRDDGDGYCVVTTLPVEMCAECQGKADPEVEVLLKSELAVRAEQAETDEPEYVAWPTLVPGVSVLRRECDERGRAFDQMWTGGLRLPPTTAASREGKPFLSRYEGSTCIRCRQPIAKGELIAKTNVGYEHERCGPK